MGSRIGIAYLPTYPKKLGQRTPLDSAMLLTMKFGPLPMYVTAPKNTALIEMAIKYWARAGSVNIRAMSAGTSGVS